MKHYVYILPSEDGNRYCGYSEDITKRLEQHNTGISKWTAKQKNWKLIYTEEYKTRTEALKRERYLKKQKSGNGLNKVISGS